MITKKTYDNRENFEADNIQDDTDRVTAIACAYFSNPSISVGNVSDIGSVLQEIRKGLSGEVQQATPELQPAVPIKKSVQPEYIICLEDGKQFKSLKRHLSTHYNMTAEEYRQKWGLPHDYPMVAPKYAEARSELAKKMGLGMRRKPEPVVTPAPRRGIAKSGGGSTKRTTLGAEAVN